MSDPDPRMAPRFMWQPGDLVPEPSDVELLDLVTTALQGRLS